MMGVGSEMRTILLLSQMSSMFLGYLLDKHWVLTFSPENCNHTHVNRNLRRSKSKKHLSAIGTSCIATSRPPFLGSQWAELHPNLVIMGAPVTKGKSLGHY